MKLVVILGFILFTVSPLFSQETVRKINTINSDSTDFSDLTFLKDVLKDVQIIGLGEQMHYDGATFDAKVRLIKYLHEELGYNVIAFESGIYDCAKANEAIKNRQTGDSSNYLNQAIFGVWNNREVHKLARYIDSTHNTENPLVLAGFDIQFAGLFAQDSLVHDFNRFIDYVETHTNQRFDIDTTKLNQSLKLLAKLSNFHKPIPPEDTLILSLTISTLMSAVNNHKISNDYTTFWKQTLISMKADYRKRYLNKKKYESSVLRDSMMAENLKHLINNQFKDEKVILWAANTHLANSTLSVDSDFHKLNLSMGKHLKKEFGNQYYFLAFTSHGGRFLDSWFLNLLITKKPKKKSIESFLYKQGHDYSFLNLRGQAEKSNPYFLNSKFFGNRPNKMNLPQIADGVFYIKEMYPATYR